MFSRGIRFDQISFAHKQTINHFEFHSELTAKDNLFKNIASYCDLHNLNVFDHVPLTFIIDLEGKTFNYDFEKFIQVYNCIKSTIASIDNASKSNHELFIEQLNEKINFSNKYKKDKKLITQRKLFLNPNHILDKNMWILKPTEFNRGRGVTVFDDIETLKKSIQEFSEGVEERIPNLKQCYQESSLDNEFKINEVVGYIKSQAFVIQKYIEQPLLINNRKFDIRVWVLVSHTMNVFLFKEGYLRTSSEIFSLMPEKINIKSIHLTNNAVQKYCEGYGNYEDGNQLSFTQFQNYLDKNYSDIKISVRNDLFRQMKEKVDLSMQAVRKKLNQNNRFYCFELFGYDFIIDKSFKVWLIEVNTNPCLEESSKLLKMLLPRMIDDTLKLTLDQIFSKKNKITEIENPFKIEGYTDSENLWDFVCQCNPVESFNRIEPNCFKNKLSYSEIIPEEMNIGIINENVLNQ